MHRPLQSLLLIGSLLALATPVAALAQTNAPTTNATGQVSIPAMPATNLVQLLGLPPSVTQVADSFVDSFVDVAPYISNDVVTLEAGGLYDSALKSKFGGFLDLTIPTTQQTAVGFGGGYLDGRFLDANVTMKLGTTTTLPILGTCYAYISTGPDYDFQSKSLGAYNFAGLIKKFTLSQNLTGTVGAAVGDISEIPGTEIAFGASLTYHY